MSLRDDVSAGLERLASKVKFDVPALSDSGMTRLEIPVPEQLGKVRDGVLTIDVHVDSSGRTFSFSTPVATTLGAVRAPFLDALLRRQQRGHQSEGLSFALEAANQYDALLAVYHWILPSISPDQFFELYRQFLMGALRVIGDLDTMIGKTDSVQRIHPKRG